MRRSWAAAVVIFAGISTICATVPGARGEVALREAGRNGTAVNQGAQNDLGKKQGAQSGTVPNGNSANGMSQNGTAEEQAKLGNADQSSFLIARRELDDPLFGKAVVLMLPPVEDGVIGLIVNRPTKITLHQLFPKIAAYKDGTAVAYFGGPIDVKTGAVLFRSTKAYKEAFHLSGDLYVSFNADLIEKVLKRPKEVTDVRLFLGRSQWGTKQLAAEMERGSWFGEKEANSVIFRRDSENVWIELIGELEPGSLAAQRGGTRSVVGNASQHRQVVCVAPSALDNWDTVTQRSRAGLWHVPRLTALI